MLCDKSLKGKFIIWSFDYYLFIFDLLYFLYNKFYLMNTIRIFFVVYLFGSVVFAFSALYVPFSPGPEVAGFLAGSDGKYEVLPAAGLILLMLLVPMAVILFLVGKVVTRKADRKQELLDQSSLIIKRHKALYNGIYGINIYINDKKYGTLMIGKPMQVGLPLGDNVVYAEAMGKKTDVVTVNLIDDLKQELLVGYELIEGKQELFLRKS